MGYVGGRQVTRIYITKSDCPGCVCVTEGESLMTREIKCGRRGITIGCTHVTYEALEAINRTVKESE